MILLKTCKIDDAKEKIISDRSRQQYSNRLFSQLANSVSLIPSDGYSCELAGKLVYNFYLYRGKHFKGVCSQEIILQNMTYTGAIAESHYENSHVYLMDLDINLECAIFATAKSN